MDPITIIVNALALGAAAGVQATAAQAVKDAYAGLKRVIHERYELADSAVGMIERRPEKEAFKEAAREALDEEGAGSDEELLRQAQTLIKAVEQHAPEAATNVNVNLEEVKAAANLRIKEIRASGSGASVDVKLKKVEAGGDIEIGDIGAGGDDSKKAAG